MKKKNGKFGQAWIVDVNMGYGHQRTAYPLKHLAFGGEIINANNYKGILEKDRKDWENNRRGYEFISRFKKIPFIGEAAFSIFNEFQKIQSFYPKRDLSKPSLALKYEISLIKKGWGRHLIKKLKERRLPLVTTFFIPAFMAEIFKYPGKIYCVICDADIARPWVSLDPKKSKIQYFAPNSRVVERLKLYGVKEKNIFLTGYPLPLENIGNKQSDILKDDLRHRILNRDPKKKYLKKYRVLVKEYLGDLPKSPDHPLTLMFAVGGAGAQKEIGIKAVRSLAKKIKDGKIKVILVAGIKEKVKEYFIKNIKKLGLEKYLDKNIEVLFTDTIEDYFKEFNLKLRKTDILWTKPSELSFYSGLGLPIIIAPTIGYQEDFNKKWIIKLGSGIVQENPNYTTEWLFDFLNSGRLAKAAMGGFIEGEKYGTLEIEKIISKKL